MSIKKKTKTGDFLDELIGVPLTFGRMIESLRKSDNLSQVELAFRMGKKKQYINNVEKGRVAVNPGMAAKFALLMGYSVPMFVAKAVEELLDKEGVSLQVNLTNMSRSFERDLLQNWVSAGEFAKSPRNFILEMLKEKKTPRRKAEDLVRKYVPQKRSEERGNLSVHP